MRHMTNIFGWKATALRKMANNSWEFDGRETFERNGKIFYGTDNDVLALNIPCPTLDSKGMESLTSALENLIRKKPTSAIDLPIRWVKNKANVKIKGAYNPNGWIGVGKEMKPSPLFMISVCAQNKYRQYYKYDPTDPMWDDRATPEAYAGKIIEMTEADIKQYIKELKEELESCKDSPKSRRK